MDARQMMETTMEFDPRQFTIDAGWDFTAIETTAAAGFVADADEETIKLMALQHGLAGDDLEDAVIDAAEALLAYCRQRAAQQ